MNVLLFPRVVDSTWQPMKRLTFTQQQIRTWLHDNSRQGRQDPAGIFFALGTWNFGALSELFILQDAFDKYGENFDTFHHHHPSLAAAAVRSVSRASYAKASRSSEEKRSIVGGRERTAAAAAEWGREKIKIAEEEGRVVGRSSNKMPSNS